MDKVLVMTVLGQDKPGIVESVASVIAEHGGNWIDSRMGHLAGQFAGILQVNVPAAQSEDIVQSLQALDAEGLTIVVHSGAEPSSVPETSQRLKLTLVGQDRPGIVQKLSRQLAELNINVEELSTACENAAMSGEVLFKAEAVLSIPASCDEGSLRAALEAIAGDIMVDIQLS